jgi:hypothetical protein
MDYHADRFKDLSVMGLKNGRLIALLPGNRDGETFYSHQGLSYGGWVLSPECGASEVLFLFEKLNDMLMKEGMNRVVYKPVPSIYHRIPSQEDLYALYRLKANRVSCTLSSTIFQPEKIPFTESRKSGIRKGMRYGLKIEKSNRYQEFWAILQEGLKRRHQTAPVHSADEIILLQQRFPENISLYAALTEQQMAAGCLLFVMKSVVHVQYISASEEGRQCGALDLLFDCLINEVFSGVPVFDFGHSNEDHGLYLNENLIFQKEGFGARGTISEIFEYNL